MKRTYLSSRSDLLTKKFTDRGKFGRNIFFTGNKHCTKTAFVQELVTYNLLGPL